MCRILLKSISDYIDQAACCQTLCWLSRRPSLSRDSFWAGKGSEGYWGNCLLAVAVAVTVGVAAYWLESNGKADYNLFIYLAKRVSRKDALVSYACSGLSLCTCSPHTDKHTYTHAHLKILVHRYSTYKTQYSVVECRGVERERVRESEMEWESCEGDTSHEI